MLHDRGGYEGAWQLQQQCFIAHCGNQLNMSGKALHFAIAERWDSALKANPLKQLLVSQESPRNVLRSLGKS